MGMTTMLLLLSSTLCAIFLLVCIISRRWQQWQVPTWLLLACCLYLLFPSSFILLPSLFPIPHPFLPISIIQACIEWVVNLAFGFVRGRWWWWIGWTN